MLLHGCYGITLGRGDGHFGIRAKPEASALTCSPQLLLPCNHGRGLRSLESHALTRWGSLYPAACGVASCQCSPEENTVAGELPALICAYLSLGLLEK